MYDSLSLICGFILIFLGGQFLVKSAAAIAQFARMPHFIVGLLIVGIGTSIPELAISLISLMQNHTGLLVGNVLGSNIANVLLVLGLTSIVSPLTIIISQRRINIGLILASTAIMIIGMLLGHLGLLIAIVMIIALIIGVFLLLKREKLDDNSNSCNIAIKGSLTTHILIFIIAVAALSIGARLIVSGAVGIATALAISESVIGLTIVAIGTSLPEIVFSLVALKHKHTDMIVGNVVGSNTFNILLGIGVPALFKPIKTQWQNETSSLIFFIISTMVLVGFLAYKCKIKRWLAVILLMLYIIFLISLY